MSWNMGDLIFIKGGKKPSQVAFVCDYREDNPPFPAVRVKRGGAEWIIKPEEIYTAEEYRAYEQTKGKKKGRTQSYDDSVPF